jgi:hypothetical protein
MLLMIVFSAGDIDVWLIVSCGSGADITTFIFKISHARLTN